MKVSPKFTLNIAGPTSVLKSLLSVVRMSVYTLVVVRFFCKWIDRKRRNFPELIAAIILLKTNELTNETHIPFCLCRRLVGIV